MSQCHNAQQDHDYFDDLPIAKWLNERNVFRNDAEVDKHEIMSIASDLNQNCYKNVMSVASTTTSNTDTHSFDEYDIEKLSLSLQFWSNNKMKQSFQKWNNYTTNKLNIIHIKYKNYKYVHSKKILLYYFKKWKSLHQSYKSTIVSLCYWANNSQMNHFKQWKKYTFETAPKSRIILCNRIRKDLCFWKSRTQQMQFFSHNSAVIGSRHRLSQLQMALQKWLFVRKYHCQFLEIEQRIARNHQNILKCTALKIWNAILVKNRRIKHLKFRFVCKQFYVWWKLQASLSMHYNNVSNNNYHSLSQQTRNVFAYWYTKRINKIFKQWRSKQIRNHSLRLKSFQCKVLHRNNVKKVYFMHWKCLLRNVLKTLQIIHETNTIIKNVRSKYYLRQWIQYKNKQNLKRRNNMESYLFFSRNTLLKCYTFLKSESKQRMHARMSQEKADGFYKAKIVQKQTQIVFGHWLLITLQKKDIKHKISTQNEINLLRKYWNQIISEYKYAQIIKNFRLKWDKINNFDLYLKVFIVWKKMCKYPISLLSVKREIERKKKSKLFHKWYLIVYKRFKLNQCQRIAANYAIQSAFVRWKVTMKHHLIRKRNEICVRNKHRNYEMRRTLVYWKRYIQHRQYTKCHKLSLNKVCDQLICNKYIQIWYYAYRLLMKLNSAKQNHIKNVLHTNMKYWCKYNRNRQKHKYMLKVSHRQYNKTLLINAILYWNTFKYHRCSIRIQLQTSKRFIQRKCIKYWRRQTMNNLSLKSRIANFITDSNISHKALTYQWWKGHSKKQNKLLCNAIQLKTQSEIEVLSTLFYIWFNKFEEQKTMRLLNEHAIGLYKEKILTQIFTNWIHILPILKREKVQLQKPKLIFNFYKWRNISAENNDLRDRLYEMELRKKEKYFEIYKEYVLCKQRQRQTGQSILTNVYNIHKIDFALEIWKEFAVQRKCNQSKYEMIRHTHEYNGMKAIFYEWKLLFEVCVLYKNNELRKCFKLWRKEYKYLQIQTQIINMSGYAMKKYAFNKWINVLIAVVTRQKCLELMVTKRNKSQKLYFLQIWKIRYKSSQLFVKSNRTNIRIRIAFWRNYARNRVESKQNICKLKSELTQKWPFYPSFIYDYNHYNFDTENDESITLSPLKSISMHLAPILAKKYELNQYKFANDRPSTPTLLYISNNNKNKKYFFNSNQSKDDMCINHERDNNEYTDFVIKPSKKQILSQILLKWKYFDSFKAFKKWKKMVQIRKEELRLMQYAKYEFRQRSLTNVICIWRNTANIHRLAQLLHNGNNNKIVSTFLNVWQCVYKYCYLSRKCDEIAVLHYKTSNKHKCIAYWNGIIKRRNKCDKMYNIIETNKPINALRIYFNKWQRLFLFLSQTRNDYNNSDIYYYKLLIKNTFRKWNRLHVTKSMISSLISNTLIQHSMNEKRYFLRIWADSTQKRKALNEKLCALVRYTEFKQVNVTFKQWVVWYNQMQTKHNIALEIYIQNTLKQYFNIWKCQFFERLRDMQLSESIELYESVRLENQMYDTVLYWKYMTESKNHLMRQEIRFYHTHLMPNVFNAWKKHIQNKRIAKHFHYLKSMQKCMRFWKIFNKKRRKIYKNINNNFQNMKSQRIRTHLNEWRVFAVKCHKIKTKATQLVHAREGIKFLSANNLQSVAIASEGRFEIVLNDSKLLQHSAFLRWKFFYERNQKIKYFFRLIRLERFVSEWIDYTKLQNRNKYLQSKVPIIAKNTSVKKHFHLWLKKYKYYSKLRKIYGKVAQRQKFNLCRNTFVAFRDYIWNEKRKQFVLRRLSLGKYIQFWTLYSAKQSGLSQKEIILNQKCDLCIQRQRFAQWKRALRNVLVSFHLNQFKISYSRSYHLQIWKSINMKHKIGRFSEAQLRLKLRQSLQKWKGFVIERNKILEMRQTAMEYYTLNGFTQVWKHWQKKLLNKYIIIDSKRILRLFHAKYVLNKWRNCTSAKQICVSAHNILSEYKRKQRLSLLFVDWKRFSTARNKYKLSLSECAYKQWTVLYSVRVTEKYKTNLSRQIFFVWYNSTKNSMDLNQQKTDYIHSKQLFKYFKFWSETMRLKQYLCTIYINASKYYINNLLFKGLQKLREHRNRKQLQRKRVEYAMLLNNERMITNAMGTILYQWQCIKKGCVFYAKIEMEKKQICFDIWCEKYNQIRIAQNKLWIGASHWRQKQLRIGINDWLTISHRNQLNRKYLSNARNKYNRKLCKGLFVFWYTNFKQISSKKQKLYQLQLLWNKSKRNHIFVAWNNTAKAQIWNKSYLKIYFMKLWKQLYLYNIAVTFERQKSIHLCTNVFEKWYKYNLSMRGKHTQLNELYLIFVDWRKERLLRQWKIICFKQQKARTWHSLTLQKKMFQIYTNCVNVLQIEKGKEFKSADHYHVLLTLKRSFYDWLNKYECNAKTNTLLNHKCEKYLLRKSENRLKARFKSWLQLFRREINEQRSLEISGKYYKNYALSKVFIEWKLYVKTTKYRAKMMTKSLSSLRHSAIMKSNNAFSNLKLLSSSQSYIRLSHNSNHSTMFKNKEFSNYLRMKRRDNGLDDNDNEINEDEYDSVLLKTPSVDSYYD